MVALLFAGSACANAPQGRSEAVGPTASQETGSTGPTGPSGEGFKLTCDPNDKFLITQTTTYSTEVGPDAATTPDSALESYFEFVVGKDKGYATATFVESLPTEEGAVQFAGVFDGDIRVIATVEPLSEGKYWAVARLEGCESEMTAIQESAAAVATSQEGSG